jgi:hypothetical protein
MMRVNGTYATYSVHYVIYWCSREESVGRVDMYTAKSFKVYLFDYRKWAVDTPPNTPAGTHTTFHSTSDWFTFTFTLERTYVGAFGAGAVGLHDATCMMKVLQRV